MNEKDQQLQNLLTKTIKTERSTAKKKIDKKKEVVAKKKTSQVKKVAPTKIKEKEPTNSLDSVQERFHGYFRQQDIDAITKAKIYLMENGISKISDNQVVQMALRAMVLNGKAVETVLSIRQEDLRRKNNKKGK